MTDKEKLNKIIDTLYPGNKAEFARKLNISPQTVTNWMNRGISKDGLTSIQKAFPSINPQWLLTGEGDMQNKIPEESPLEIEAIENSEANDTANEEDEIPEKFVSYLVPMAAMGGSLVGFEEEGVMRENCERVISPIANIDLVVPVCGESMEPEYPNGSKVYVRRINPDDFIAWGNVYVLDTTNGIIIKVVVESERENCVRCVSLNPSGRYTPFDVPKRTIRAMYRVMLCVSVK